MEKKFHLGDHIMLTCKGDHCNPEYGLRGIVIDYDKSWSGLYPVVQLDEDSYLYNGDDREVDWFEESWWTLIGHPNECACDSLL
ncbi:MAG: hypothetical protein UC771_14525 [Faecalibacterium sp.]|nr:hypothetical protein [Faecalibacterium sp.]